jgi:lipopolysaccharide/colanic/teichoic acid biosynthesis glycosyltransferase
MALSLISGTEIGNSSLIRSFLKRCFDLVMAFILLILLSPLLLIIATAIKLMDGSPIFYPWKVVGRNGKPFTGYKFRTMVRNADKLKRKLLDRNEMTGPVFKLKDDPRITPLGKVLRKFSFDELPQIWSVVRGHMSLVGPRPPLQYEYSEFTENQKKKMVVKPGMTSLWQVSGKPPNFDEWLQLDLYYVVHRSFWLDMKILFKTLLVVIRGDNH